MRLLRALIWWMLALLVAGAVVVFLWPELERPLRYADLLRQPAPGASSLPLPLPGVRFADTWGAARSEGRTHEGVDIFASRGTPIRSTTAGLVGHVGENSLGGRTVTVTGPGGYHHYYAHLERYPALREGDWVDVGEVIGYVGNSGDAARTPTHLHYGVYTPAWRAVNPYPLLRKGWR